MIKEGTILESGNGKYTYEVIKHRLAEKYNLLNLKTNQLEFIIFDTLEGLEEKVEVGIFKYKESVLDVRTHVFLKEEEEEWKVLHRDWMKRREEEKRLDKAPSESKYAMTPEGIVVKRVFNNPYSMWVDTLGEVYNAPNLELELLPSNSVKIHFLAYENKGKLLGVRKEDGATFVYEVPVEEEKGKEEDTEEAKYFIVTEDIKGLFNRVVLDRGTILKKLDRYTYMDTLGKKYGGAVEEDLQEVSNQPRMEFLFDEAVDGGNILVYNL